MLFSEKAFEREHIVVTGASRGIGREAALQLVSSGAFVTLTGRNRKKLEEVEGECQSRQGEVQVVIADLNDEKDRRKLVKSVEEFAPVTGLVNSAGILNSGEADQISEEELRSVMEVNYFSTAFLTQSLYEEMKKRKRGAVVNVTSLSGLRGTDGNLAYCASKFALTGFTQSFAHEAIRSNIRVNAVAPGFVDTEMGRQAVEAKAGREGRTFEEQWELAKAGNPSGRITTSSEVASAILFLLSEASGNIVGESMKISGGSVMR
ncbi:SDR family NAD(P)-dependent oxidoreductase [Salimicrobium flavidum]|uniref:3-oxoacyl-[acyl-carrier protein] reductase n=1 Tax=Salimicrobium flavidum TaxID=570947 RepID=A0A1N7K8C9_9BACI|nr:SDR family oxidoreductase [Salimicrobium flavidum]SIS57704.1 3-oxoacyl-[acyl-carrier protein] reductase [Salimicrobium flavidum]